MNDKPLPKISFDHKELIEKLNKPFFIFGRGDSPLKHVPPIKLDQSKNNPHEDMLAFNWPYIELARMHMEAIKQERVNDNNKRHEDANELQQLSLHCTEYFSPSDLLFDRQTNREL